MKRVPLIFPFFLALIATGYSSVFFPNTRIHTFVPFLALLYSRCSRISSFWISSLCGLIIDLLGSQLRFGVYAASFSTATLLLYHQKKHFYNDKPLALSLFTFQISLIVTLALFMFSLLSQTGPSISLKWVVIDCFFMSFLDSLYAFLWFSCPMRIYTALNHTTLRTFFSKILRFIEWKKKL